MNKIIAVFVFLIACLTGLGAVEIQLENNRNPEEKAEMAMGYVDVNALFAEHPMTVRMKQDFFKEAAKRKQDMNDIHKAIKGFEEVIVSSTTELKSMKQDLEKLKQDRIALLQSNSTDTLKMATVNEEIKNKENLIIDKEKSIENLRADTEKRKSELYTLKRKDKEELEKLENKQTEAVLADLYQVIEEVAKEENLTVVLDKNNILYGKTPKNITDKVRVRLRGR